MSYDSKETADDLIPIWCQRMISPLLIPCWSRTFNIGSADQDHVPAAIAVLTRRGRARHICVSILTIIVSNKGLSPGQRQAIIWTNAGLLLIGPLETNFSEISMTIHIFSFTKMHLNMSSGKWRPVCLGFNVLTWDPAKSWSCTKRWRDGYIARLLAGLRTPLNFIAIAKECDFDLTSSSFPCLNV